MGLTRPGLALSLLLAASAQAQPQAIDQLPLQGDGDIRTLPAGTYTGNFTIDQPLHLRCAPGAVIDGQGAGSTLPGISRSASAITLIGFPLMSVIGPLLSTLNRQARSTFMRPTISMCSAWQNQLQ